MASLSAADLATYVRYKRADIERGTLLVRSTATGNAVACIFGNDNFRSSAAAHREVDLLRSYLRQVDFHEVGIGLSRDGYSWAVLVEVEVLPFQTAVGRAFHVEMMRACLEELVVKAWQEAVRETRE